MIGVELDYKSFQFLYVDDKLHFMDLESFEEHTYPLDLVEGEGGSIQLLL